MLIASAMKCGTILALALLVLVAAAQGGPRPADARNGTYRVTLIRVSYTDTTSRPYTLTQVQQATDELRVFFSQLSYGNLDMPFRVVEVTLPNTRAYYFTGPPWIEDLRIPAMDAAAANGVSFANVDAIIFLHPFCDTDTAFVARLGWIPPSGGARSWFQTAYDFECVGRPPGTPPGASGVWWGPWAHELGHILQFADGINTSGAWEGHPSGYASGYDLMDSSYPAHESAYGLSGPPAMMGPRPVFPGWLPASEFIEVSAPGPSESIVSRSAVLQPLSQRPDSSPLPQAIKIPIMNGVYYLVEARRRQFADARNVGPGIWDEGVHILLVREQGDPPVRTVDSCDTLVENGCVRNTNPMRAGYDTRTPNCRVDSARTALDVPAYCWPYPLWQPGQTFRDPTNNVEIRVDDTDGSNFKVTVTRGASPIRPDVYLTRWFSAPMNTRESVDIWIDSSCNGYESEVGARGLSFGRRGDGSVVGNGDNICLHRPHRIYARVRNGGTAVANNVVVRFNTLGTTSLTTGSPRIGRGSWLEEGVITIPTIDPGRFQDVFVPWIPGGPEHVTGGLNVVTPELQVVIDPLPDELVIDNQDGIGEQENLAHIAVYGTRNQLPARFDPFQGRGSVRIEDPPFPPPDPLVDPPLPTRVYFLDVRSQLPQDWVLELAKGATAVEVPAGGEVTLPLVLSAPEKLQIGDSYLVEISANYQTALYNPAIPQDWFVPPTHVTTADAGGVALLLHAVEQTELRFDSIQPDGFGNLVVAGRLDPVPKEALVLLEYVDPFGKTASRLVAVDDKGAFADALPIADAGRWSVSAIFLGDLVHSGAVAETKIDIGSP